MAKTSHERTGELLHALFRILLEHPEGLSAGEALTRLRNQVVMTEYEKGRFDSGALRFDTIVRFATVDASKAGWLLKQRGLWTVTQPGQEAFTTTTDPKEFYRLATKLYREWRSKTDVPSAGEAEEATEGVGETEKASEVTFEQAEEQAWNEIEQYLKGMPAYEFQDLVAALLRAMGYHIAWVAPEGRDGGIDILAYTDPLGTRPPRIKVQVKRYSGNVPVGDVRSFTALLGDDDVGLFVTTSDFTRDAQIEAARSQEKRKITLVNLERLIDLWIKHSDRLDEAARRRLPLQPIYFLAPGI